MKFFWRAMMFANSMMGLFNIYFFLVVHQALGFSESKYFIPIILLNLIGYHFSAIACDKIPEKSEEDDKDLL